MIPFPQIPEWVLKLFGVLIIIGAATGFAVIAKGLFWLFTHVRFVA